MQIRKPTESFDNLTLTISGHVGDSGEIIASNVDTILRIGIDEVGNIYDQLLALGNTADQNVTININRSQFIFGRKMAIELMRIVEQVWFDYEIGDTSDVLPEEEWTEEYLLSLG